MKNYNKTKGELKIGNGASVYLSEYDIDLIMLMRVYDLTFNQAIKKLKITRDEFLESTRLNNGKFI